MSDYCKLIDPNCKHCGGTGNDQGGLPMCRECEAQYRQCVARAKLAMQRDAERYRWLRDIGDDTWTALAKRYLGINSALIDSMVDVAIEKSKA